ncbi:polyprenyl synthetase family protein [Ketogulonicigenium vulgare]|uniref:Geranylgeranyl diphosphate synthase n=1 Tax=Ketogulonicigenium vulgare (strain WSH-001) TaxID=759362 RepID=F9Y857_KETVW|nr:polyprenyl synthetase family protein [Ketogulonicigenium vulgare]ADO41490.1 geranylgeranyl pyrophosphate synthetase [Ketogulonicigenium vulgare Y25]AEM42343.1 Polyprenyl synthetase superfamily protein [Ketogulonicigenium vulgare WSH-001]ALJ79968.1 farnesyl-diphosphate synthase [Ketogulonicigenium vulgare]ANW32861.1 farnesyl-diphosphate synthase [Ketogulonicigenium vulgare]AOZ53425.1 geranylgeranyl pyrophosphate synthetase [Ketogulonicigenium vulgare]
MQSLSTRMAAAAADVQALIAAHLSPLAAASPVASAMIYACTGGKGLRGFLVLESARLHGIAYADALPVAAAVEAVHAYSLVHDDMPAMDDDDLRRGRPTVHRQWDEATALLAGDALQSLGFELIATAALPDSARVTLLAGFARAAGIHGMVGGQEADIAAETAARPLSLDQIIALQRGKTGALITWSASAGAVMAGADAAPLRAFGDAIGLAFQITDDILDVEGSAATMGKAVQKDAAAGKATFVSLLGLQGAKDQALALLQTADAALIPYGATAATLRETAQFVITRQN